MQLSTLLVVSQLILSYIMGLYFFTMLKNMKSKPKMLRLDSTGEAQSLQRLRKISLTQPLSEKTRPEKLEEVIGQEKGIEALKYALCSPNPQHIIIYGPPGVGKTAAARLLLELAKKDERSPFKKDAAFVEINGATLQFDERSIADPLLGSVHDPIYQGAGAYGALGVPQIKAGAVTKAHGGVLFIDEIGEMPVGQMNKLLKVLEDRRVTFTSSYYNKHDINTPEYVHEVFKNGLPADFRLIGATTRSPEQIPSALRSRCTEIYFRSLNEAEVISIAQNACERVGLSCEEGVCQRVAEYSANGRDTVNIIQAAASIAIMDKREEILNKDIQKVAEYGRYIPCLRNKIEPTDCTGRVNGLAVSGFRGFVLETEVSCAYVKENGRLKISGIAEEEETKQGASTIRRRSNIRASVDNALTLIERLCNIRAESYDIHINFPGGMPVDGPSAGITIFCALYSAMFSRPVSSAIAMTGEIGLDGRVHPVGGVGDKIQGARERGIKKVVIPFGNAGEAPEDFEGEIILCSRIEEVILEVFGERLSSATA